MRWIVFFSDTPDMLEVRLLTWGKAFADKQVVL